MKRGRFTRRAAGWMSAVVTVIVVVVVLAALLTYVKSRRTPFGVEATAIDQRVADTADGCFWEIDVSVANSSDRRVVLLTARLADIDGSTRGLTAAIDPGETLVRTYRHELESCDVDVAALGADELDVDVRRGGGGRVVTLSASIPPLGDALDT